MKTKMLSANASARAATIERPPEHGAVQPAVPALNRWFTYEMRKSLVDNLGDLPIDLRNREASEIVRRVRRANEIIEKAGLKWRPSEWCRSCG
jgi:hypothetical protein